MFPLSCAPAQSHTARTFSAHKKIYAAQKKIESNINRKLIRAIKILSVPFCSLSQ